MQITLQGLVGRLIDMGGGLGADGGGDGGDVGGGGGDGDGDDVSNGGRAGGEAGVKSEVGGDQVAMLMLAMMEMMERLAWLGCMLHQLAAEFCTSVATQR